MPPVTHPRTPLWTALRGQLQHSHQARTTRKALERELGTYTTQSDLNDLHAILDRYPDRETDRLRRILAAQPAA